MSVARELMPYMALWTSEINPNSASTHPNHIGSMASSVNSEHI